MAKLPRPTKKDLDALAVAIREHLTPEKMASMIHMLVVRARKGNIDAAKILFDRGFGKAKETIEIGTPQMFDAQNLSTEDLLGLNLLAMHERGQIQITDPALLAQITHTAPAIEGSFVEVKPTKAEAGLRDIIQETENALRAQAETRPDAAIPPAGTNLVPSPDPVACPGDGSDPGGPSPELQPEVPLGQPNTPVSALCGIVDPRDADPSTLLDECEEETGNSPDEAQHTPTGSPDANPGLLGQEVV